MAETPAMSPGLKEPAGSLKMPKAAPEEKAKA